MKSRTTLVLFLLVLIGGAFIWIWEVGMGSAEECAKNARKALHFDPDNIEWLWINNAEGKFECERREAGWYIIRPIEARADEAVINRLFSELQELENTTVITRRDMKKRGLSEKDYGLDLPRYTILMKGALCSKEIKIGRNSPVGGNLFIACGDACRSEVMSVSTNLLAAIPERAGDLRDKTLFDCTPGNVRRVEIKTSDGFVSFGMSDAGDWMILQPFTARADKRKIDLLISDLCGLRIDRFLRDDTADKAIYGFDEIDSAITITEEGDATPRDLKFGLTLPMEKNMIYAGFDDDDSVFALPAAVLKTLKTLPIADMRDRNLIGHSLEGIKVVRIGRGEQMLRFELKDGEWAMTRPRSWRVDKTRMDQLIGDWSSSVVQQFLPPTPANIEACGLETNVTTISFSRNLPYPKSAENGDDKDWITLKVGVPLETLPSVAVRVGTTDWVSIISNNVMNSTSIDPLYYRDRTILALPPAGIHSITLKKDGSEQMLSRDNEGAFQPKPSDKGRTVRKLPQTEKLELLKALVCQRYIAMDDGRLERYGLLAPKCEITLGLSGEGISKTLLFGDTLKDGGVYAQLRGQDVVCVLNERAVDMLCSDLYVAVDEKPAK